MRQVFLQSFTMRLFGAGAGFVTTVILGRLLGPAGFGPYALAMGWLGVATLFTTLGFQHFTVRAIPSLVVGGHLRAVTGLIIFAVGVTTGLALFAMLLTPIIVERFNLFSDPAMELAILAAGFLFLPVTINQVRQGILRGLGRPLSAQFPEFVLQPVLFIALIVLAAVFGSRLDAVRVIELMLIASGICVVAGICLLVPSINGKSEWPPVFTPVSWLSQAGSSFYLFAAATVMSATDLLMLGHLSNAQETGIYGVAARFYMLMMLPSLATSSILSHEVSRLYAAGQRSELEATVRRTAGYAAIVSAAIALVCTLATFYLGAIFGVEFEAAAVPILILVWSRAVECLLGQPAVILANTTFVGLAGAVVTGAAVLNAILNALLIPQFGASGAATATATAHVAMSAVFVALALWKPKVMSLPFFQLQTLNKATRRM